MFFLQVPAHGVSPCTETFFGSVAQIDGDSFGGDRYKGTMKISRAHTFRQIPGTPPSLEERLSAALAENECLRQLVELQAKRFAELQRQLATLTQENLALRERLNRNSTNSNQPPSQDNPFQPPQKKPELPESAALIAQTAKAGVPSSGKKSRPYHKGARQPLLPADEHVTCPPEPCSCGCCDCVDVSEAELHQWIDLPPVRTIRKVVHYHVQKGRCRRCGKEMRGRVPKGHATGYGPSLTAFVATMNSAMTVSWRKLADCLHDVFGIPISAGAVGKCLKRASSAIEPHYEAIGRAVRASPVNHVDETSWRQHGPCGKKLHWLWVLVNREAAFFRLAPSRRAEEFEALVGEWTGTLVSDDYAVYRKWPHGRQSCLAHLIRAVQGLSESADSEIAACGRWMLLELLLLVRMSPETPEREWQAWQLRFSHWVEQYRTLSGKAGALVRRLAGESDELTTFLRVPGVEPTNNLAEQSLRHGVLQRKISIGSASEAGRRWVERALSLRHTCRSQNKSFFEVMRDALNAHFQKLTPDLRWIENIHAQYVT